MPTETLLIEGEPTGDVKTDGETIARLFASDATFLCRALGAGCRLFFFDGMSNGLLISESILKPVDRLLAANPDADVNALRGALTNGEVSQAETYDEAVKAVMYGDCLLVCRGGILIVGVKGWPKRSTEEPDNEKVTRGPRESFVEASLDNLNMLRRKLQTPKLCVERAVFGEMSNTRVYICYLENRANPEILAELKRRLSKIETECILDSNYILEQIRDCPHSPLKTVGVTERPDIVAAKMAEGRVALIVDGTPCVLTVPFIFAEVFQSNEDYYTNYIYASINRYLRMLGFLLTLCLPSLYIAIVAFHQEALPPTLLLSITASRQGVPFPIVLEMLMLLLAFEILREASIRMPNSIGQALSIVGALVLGQSAVEAGFVSAPMVIIIALTGTTSLIIPRAGAAILCGRLYFLICTSFFGIVGFTLALFTMIFAVSSMESFGAPYTSVESSSPGAPLNDIYSRARWGKLRYRRLFSDKKQR